MDIHISGVTGTSHTMCSETPSYPAVCIECSQALNTTCTYNCLCKNIFAVPHLLKKINSFVQGNMLSDQTKGQPKIILSAA